MVLFAVEASAVSSGRPCGVYMFSGLTTQVFNIYDITGTLFGNAIFNSTISVTKNKICDFSLHNS